MKGDFSRVSFDPLRRFSRVLMQQGRVLTDSDWNEQTSIHLHLLRALAADLIGPHGGPEGAAGFEITRDGDDLRIGAGRYYVDGWLCENIGRGNIDGISWTDQADYEERRAGLEEGASYIAYLDVWERHVSSSVVDGAVELERRNPVLLRELALGGPDTASRAEVAWRVRLFDLDEWQEWIGVDPQSDWKAWFGEEENLRKWRSRLQPPLRGSLVAEAKVDEGDGGPCVIPPESRYRGLENQLYRVEIHEGGHSGSGATFKWSRENGSVVLPITDIDGERITLALWWRDRRSGLEIGQWVEIGDDGDATERDPADNMLRRIVAVDPDRMTVRLDEAPHFTHAEPTLHPRLRRWDHGRRVSADGVHGALAHSNALQVLEDHPIELEDGVRITFRAAEESQPPHEYRRGDYWLIPARTAIGDVVWPLELAGANGTLEPSARPPHGVEHHYAPLAVVPGGGAPIVDLRRIFEGLAWSS